MVFWQPVVNPKRSVGPIRVVNVDGKPVVELHYKGETRRFTPEDIVTLMIAEEKKLRVHNPKNCFFMIPSYFTFLQKMNTMNAWVFAGVPDVMLVEEPLLAIIAYSLHDNPAVTDKNVFVFDLGATTLAISMLTQFPEDGFFRVIANSGLISIGGVDFTNRLMDYCVAEFKIKQGKDVSNNDRALKRLWDACERAKRVLSTKALTTIEIDNFYEGVDFFCTISRPTFEQLTTELLRKITDKVRDFIKEEHLGEIEIHEIVLCGGSSSMYTVQNLLETYFEGKKVHDDIPPEQVVTLGAFSIAKGFNSQKQKQMDQDDAVFEEEEQVPLAVGIEGDNGVMKVLFPADTKIPAKKDHIFTTHFDDQTSMDIELFQGRDALTKYNYFLGTLELHGIPAAPRGVPQIEVCIEIGKNGRVKGWAHDMATGKEISLGFKTGRVLSTQQMNEVMFRQGKKRTDAMECLRRYIYRMTSAVKEEGDGGRVEGAEKQMVEKEIEETIQWLQRDSGKIKIRQIEDILKKLQDLWEPIVARFKSFPQPEPGPEPEPEPETLHESVHEPELD